MEFYILSTTSYGLELLRYDTRGTVHSIYRNTINISIGGSLISIHTSDAYITPISFVADIDADTLGHLPIIQGMQVLIAPNIIEFLSCTTNVVFHVKNPSLYQTRITNTLTRASQLQLHKQIGIALKKTTTGGFHNLPTPFQTVAQECIDIGTKLFCSGDLEGFAQVLSNLLGLGIGLTPSGDDFLCGVLAGFSLAGQRKSSFTTHLCSNIKLRQHQTNDISGAFISCAMEDHFSSVVVGLSALPSDDELLTSFEKIGHSSGIDTLQGVYYGLGLLLSDHL